MQSHSVLHVDPENYQGDYALQNRQHHQAHTRETVPHIQVEKRQRSLLHCVSILRVHQALKAKPNRGQILNPIHAWQSIDSA